MNIEDCSDGYYLYEIGEDSDTITQGPFPEDEIVHDIIESKVGEWNLSTADDWSKYGCVQISDGEILEAFSW